MHNYKSEQLSNKGQRLSLPKISISPPQNKIVSKNPSLILLQKQRSRLILLKQMKPFRNKGKDGSQSDDQKIFRNIFTPKKVQIKLQPALPSLNQNRKQVIKNKSTKQIFVGQQAVKKYYDRYKHLQKYHQKEKFTKKNNVITDVIKLLDGNGFPPRKLDLIKLKGSHAILDLNALSLGVSNMGSVVTELIGLMGNFQYVDLSNNRIDKIISQYLVSELGKVKIVNLSHNRIGKIACDRFYEMFTQPRTQIQQLYLSDNSLLDNAGCSLIRGLLKYNYLRVLDLSKNFLALRSAKQIQEYLAADRSLEQLYLGWNQFTDNSAKFIFQGVQQHTELKVFDYSWNVVGMFSISSLQKLISFNQSLIHFDISFCEIDKTHTNSLALALQNNHSIYGLHYEGNSGYINRKGSLLVLEKQFKEYPLPIVKGVIRKIDSVKPNMVHNEFRENHVRDICWICDSWQQVYIEVKNEDPRIKQCYLHIESQNFIGIKMNTKGEFFFIYRMHNRGEMKFLFTFIKESGEMIHFQSKSYPFSNNYQQIELQIQKKRVKTDIAAVNCLEVYFREDPVDQGYNPNIHCLPRYKFNINKQQLQFKEVESKQERELLEKQKKNEKILERLKSKFRELDQSGASTFARDLFDRDDDQDYIRKCLEYDIANSKIKRLVKKPEDLRAFKQNMVKFYKIFKDTFYTLASSNPSSNGIYSIPENLILQFVQEQKYFTKRVTLPKIMLKLYSCLVAQDYDSPEKKANEAKLICRPQFLEFLVRVAIEKWCYVPIQKKKKEDMEEVQAQEQRNFPLSLTEAMEKIMKGLDRYKESGSSVWRKQKFLTIDIYTVLKGYQQFLTSLYEKYCEKKVIPEKQKKIKKLLSLQQLKQMFQDLGIRKLKQSCDDCNSVFLAAKRLEVEDGESQFGLTYHEFCQSLARYSQINFFPPVSTGKTQIWAFSQIPLFLKFESLIVNLYRNKPEFHTKRFNKIAEKGLFQQQTEILFEEVQKLASKTQNCEQMNEKIQLQEEQMTLKYMIKQLKQKQKLLISKKEEFHSDEEASK